MTHEHQRIDDDMTSLEIKAIMKDALKEWLDEKFMEFGRLSMNAVLAAVVVAVAYFVLRMNGWHKVN